jgi:hypothetical protein
MLLGLPFGGFVGFLRDPFAREAVLADEPAPEIDGAAPGGAKREGRVLRARLDLRPAGGTAGHAVVLGAEAAEFKRVARDSRCTKD